MNKKQTNHWIKKEQTKEVTKPQNVEERLTNCKRVEDKVLQGQVTTDFDLYNIYWEKVLSDHKERLETEA